MFFDENVHIEEDDQCFTCEHFNKGVNCPLLEALAERVVSLDSEITVNNCGFYKEFHRHLRLVEPLSKPQDDEPQKKKG